MFGGDRVSRLIHRTVQVVTEHNQPKIIVDGESQHRVTEILDYWVEAGEWWNGEPHRDVYRVLTDRAFMFDVELFNDEWFIYRVWD